MADVFDQLAGKSSSAVPPAASPTSAGQAPTTPAPQQGGDIFDQLAAGKDVSGNQAQPSSPEEVGTMWITGGLGTMANPLTVGAIKGLGETAHTIGRVINAATGDNIKWLPTSLEEPKELGSANGGEIAGKIGESIAEFALGDEALKGLSIAEKLGIAHKITEFAKTSPLAAKLLDLGLNAIRGGAVGGVTGGAHEGKQGAETGAALGAGAELAAPVVSKVAGKVVEGAKAVKSALFPSEEVGSQVTKDLIRKSLGNKADADIVDEIAGRIDKPKVLSSVENEMKLAKANIDTELPSLNSQLDQTLAGSTAQTGNAARLVNKTFDDLIGNVHGGVGTEKDAAVAAINDVRKEVMGKVSNDPMTAEQVNNVKRLVGDQIKKFAPPENLSSVDAQKKEAYRQAYFKLRDIVSDLAPESKAINMKISRSITAQDLLEKLFPQLESPEAAKASYQGVRSQAARGVAKKAAVAVGTGALIGEGAKLGLHHALPEQK